MQVSFVSDDVKAPKKHIAKKDAVAAIIIFLIINEQTTTTMKTAEWFTTAPEEAVVRYFCGLWIC